MRVGGGSERGRKETETETQMEMSPLSPHLAWLPRGEKLGWGSPQASPEERGEFKESWGWNGARVVVVVEVMMAGWGGEFSLLVYRWVSAIHCMCAPRSLYKSLK